MQNNRKKNNINKCKQTKKNQTKKVFNAFGD